MLNIAFSNSVLFSDSALKVDLNVNAVSLFYNMSFPLLPAEGIPGQFGILTSPDSKF